MTSKLRVPLALLALAAGCAGPSVSYKLNLKPYALEATDFALPSGLRVLFQEDRSQPSVIVTSVFDVGSADDPVGKEGMAHLIEHLCFRAIHGKNSKVMDHLKEIGAGNFNASTGDDYTDYYTVAPKEALVTLLQIEALRMLNPIEGVTEADLKIEREVVRNELRMRTETTVDNKIYELSKEMVFPEGHVYHRTGIGTHESLNAITLDDVNAWLKKNYVPSNTTIVVAGDFDRAKAGQLLAQNFPLSLVAAPGATPDAKLVMQTPEPRVKTASAAPPAPADKAMRRIKGPVTAETVVLAWSMPGAYRDNEPLIETTVQSMSYAIGSLLYPEDLDSEDKIEGIGCFPAMNRDASIAICYVELAEGQTADEISKKAIDGLWELWNTDNEEFQRRAFNRAKADYQAGLFRQSASLFRAIPLAHYLHYRGRADMFAGSIERVGKISAFEAREFAYKYLTRERVVRLVISPYDAKEKPAGSVAFDQGSSWAGATLDDADQGVTGITDAQIEALAVAPDVKQVKNLTLANGLKVVLKKHGSAPFLNVGLYLGGGSRSASPWGYPDFVFPADDARDPGQIAGVWSGADLGDGEFLSVEAPSGNLDAALDLVSTRVRTTRTQWERRPFESVSKRYQRRQKTEEKRPEVWAARALWNLVLHDHPYGRTSYDFTAIERLGVTDYQRWITEQLAPKNATLFVVGDIDLAEAEKKVTAMWSDWRAGNPGAALPGYPKPPVPPSRQIAFLDNPEGTQTDLRLACHLAPVTSDNDAAREALVTVLREDLWAAIREKAGASYGVQVFADHASGGLHVLQIGSLVQNDKVKPSLQIILDRLAAVKNAKVAPGKLASTKWALAGGTHTENLSIDEMIFTLIGLQRDGRSVEALSGYPKRLASVTNKDLSDLLAPCVGHEVATVMGPEAAIRKSVESLNIPVETVDWRKGANATPSVNTN